MGRALKAMRFGKRVLNEDFLDPKFKDHYPGLTTWWGAFKPTNGLVVQSISPFQQKILSPMLAHPGERAATYFRNWRVAIPWAGALFFLFPYLESKTFEAEQAEWP